MYWFCRQSSFAQTRQTLDKIVSLTNAVGAVDQVLPIYMREATGTLIM